jgi:periplasmic protein TonB
MSNQLSYKIDINEIIFTGKNKEYGAYQLRKSYNKFLTLAIWICIFFFVSVTTGPLIYNKLKPVDEIKQTRRKIIKVSELAEPPSIGEKKEIEKVEAPPPLKSTIAFLPPVVKPDEQVSSEYIPTVEELKNVDPGAKTQQGVEGGVDYSLLEVQESVEEKVVKEEKKEEPFTYVEEMPSYPTGTDELLSFISSHIEYPEIAKRAGVEGKVLVQFVVEKSGDITEVQVLKGIGAGCDEEAVRVCKMMPRWKAGKQNGKPVRVKMVIPFVFKLQG